MTAVSGGSWQVAVVKTSVIVRCQLEGTDGRSLSSVKRDNNRTTAVADRHFVPLVIRQNKCTNIRESHLEHVTPR